MKHNFILSIIGASACAIALTACDSQGSFKVDGSVNGLENSTLMLQTSLHGRWITIDSTKTDDKGKFTYTRQSPDFPGIYRLANGNDAIYFPIDSIDHITIAADKSSGVLTYTLSGSGDAEAMTAADSKVVELRSAPDDKKALIKRSLAELIVANPAGNAAYYILNKEINGTPVFDPADPADLKLHGAVANAFSTKRPNDPRTPLIVAKYIQNRQINPENIASRDTIVAKETRIIELNLPDEKGTRQSLTEITSHGKVVVLNFTVYAADESPAFNKNLADLYSKYGSRGFEIYQVSLDPNIASWKLAAQNLPWITVYDEAGANSRNVRNYNVGALPVSFVIDRNGEVAARIADHSTLDAEIKKHI